MMNCDQVAFKIDAYLDGALSDEESRSLTAHVAACSRCSVQFAALLRAVAVLQDLPELRAPDEMIPDVLRRLPAYQPGAAALKISTRSAVRVEWALGLIGAAGTAAIIGALAWMVRQMPAWWDSLGAIGRVLEGLAVKGAIWAADAATIAAIACSKPLMYGLLIDVVLLAASLLLLAAWRRKSSQTIVLLTF